MGPWLCRMGWTQSAGQRSRSRYARCCARHASNKARKWLGGSLKLSKEEKAAAESGMESGSLESERAKVKALLTYSEELETEHDARFCPEAAGLLVPDCVTRPDKPGKNPERKRMSQLHGSTTMRNLAVEAKKRRVEYEEKAQTTAANKQQRAEKKEEKAAAAAEEAAGFAYCEARCKCKKNPCPYALWKRCPECGPKKGECRVRACIAARGPLLLGWNRDAGEE